MLRTIMHVRWRALLVGLTGIAALALTSCGGGDECADVNCEFGECSPETGECVNPSECLDDDDCLAGYECGAALTCEPSESCESDDDCSAGVCEDEACVNPSSCEENADCVEGTFCGPDETCEADPCNETHCPRGVCERGTDNCVSRDSCTKETETDDCIEGEKCADGTCADEDAYCDELECERGECSFEEGGCVNADDCGGDDEQCLENHYCSDSDECERDLCEERDVDCGDNGVCVPSLGQCENAQPCDSDAECTEGHVCVNQECRLEGAACGDSGGDGGCPGNQLCVIEDGDAECEEPDECETSLDCTEGRQCGGQTCMGATDCSEDLYEPNDDADDATPFFDVARDSNVKASLCEDDADVFTFDSADIIDGGTRGRLIVDVEVAEHDIGLGEVDVELTDANGSTHAASTGEMGADGRARIDLSLDVTNHGDHTVEVSAGKGFEEAGVDYELSVDLLSSTAAEACEEAPVLQGDQRVSGTTADAESNSIGSTCTSFPVNQSQEIVYAYEVDRPREVTFDLTPQVSTADLSMALREECEQSGSEIACVDQGGKEGEDDDDDVGEGEPETMTRLLDPGTYYLIVQAPEGAEGGLFQLDISTVDTPCGAESSYCEDPDTAQLCTADGGNFQSYECRNGCDPSRGRCATEEGDNCLDAPSYEADPSGEDGDEGFAESIDLPGLDDTMDMDEQTCLSDNELEPTQSNGPDKFYEITLPPETGLNAEVEFDNDVVGSMYIIDECSPTEASCLEGAKESTDESWRETLSYSNLDDEDEETVYLAVDTAENQNFGEADLEVDFAEVVCDPEEERRCDPDSEGMQQVCNEWGVGWEDEVECELFNMCADGYCVTGDDCDGAYDVTTEAADADGVTFDWSWDDFSDNFSGYECVGDGESFYTEESEAVMKADLKDGETITMTMTAVGAGQFDSPIMAPVITSDCQDAVNSCLDGRYDFDTAKAEYTADGDETVYLFADAAKGGADEAPDCIVVDVDDGHQRDDRRFADVLERTAGRAAHCAFFVLKRQH
ncbi:MAG: hypothetical protein ACOCV2_00910, partial [Persicimonas sp.]